ncbi:flagellar basal body-associated FliL family protein [Campylobacter sp. US33a]|uniref:Flagellar protein FliL n=1 Tax=Campylobacter sp. CCS1377 TaxID=3158229 RepID=A0AAU7E696_9BACT|nr:flagellar basal body-associated FliL family protein [Campylobacter sp. US33a]TEY03504.1 hypothetical protein ELQ16_02825 [Campylobacter sp. US33a]
MKILLCLFISVLALKALVIENFRTDLYSKSTINALKKIEMTLEFEGQNLEQNSAKIKDSINTVISSFFYEDIFTELGKNKFKETLIKFINKKYKLQIKNIYFISLNGVKEFDLEEFKRFLQNIDEKNEIKGTKPKEEIQKMQKNQPFKIKQIDTLFQDENGSDDINLPSLKEKLNEQILKQLENNQSVEKNSTGFDIKFDPTN